MTERVSERAFGWTKQVFSGRLFYFLVWKQSVLCLWSKREEKIIEPWYLLRIPSNDQIFFCRPSTMINIILKRRRITKSIGRQNILATNLFGRFIIAKF